MGRRVMVLSMCLLAALCFLSGAHGVASAQSLSSSLGVMPYPSKGQTPQQQTNDEGQCFAWAKQQTGIDPFAVANAPAYKESGPAVGGGERVSGAARGAAGGALIGAIAGDAGKGAAIGAVGGTMVGGKRARDNRASREQQAAQSKSNTLNQFNKAFCSCMEGRGYTVSR
jgi:hypothetical protein